MVTSTSPVDGLLCKEIRTLEEFHRTRRNCIFVALDCEFVSDIDWEIEKDPAKIYASQAATEVGMACLDDLSANTATTSVAGRKPCLKSFVKGLRVQACSIKVSERYYARIDRIARLYPDAKPKIREPFLLGGENYLNAGELEKTVCDSIKSYGQCTKRNLILVGYDIKADMNAMRQDFPSAADLFAGWLDIRTIIKSIFTGRKVDPPGVRLLLKLFGYGREDYGINPEGVYHNAGNDAIKTLALLHGITIPENIENLHLREQVPRDVLLHDGLKWRGTDIVSIRPTDGSSLPNEIGTALKLAAFAGEYELEAVGVFEQYISLGGDRKTKVLVTRGWIKFAFIEHRTAFIGKTDFTRIGGKVVRAVISKVPPFLQREHEEMAEEERNLLNVMANEVES